MTERNRHRRELILTLPDWVDEFLAQWDHDSSSDEAKMRFVIELARRNVEHQTGGPFGAAVFDASSGKLIALGINLVEPANCSIAHAEMVAIALAQQTLGSFDLGQGARSCELVTSTEPCAMCLGAIPWSGVRHVICGARGEDASAIGFDEGAKPNDWIGALASRGIEVTRDVLRDEARAVLNHYHTTGGRIYNARSD
jgi:tRNA(Arg) A34 adenosine deaminase TadA